jgi:cyclic pyranopterin phosphate synthase
MTAEVPGAAARGAHMVDVTAKDVTAREATATGRVATTAEVIGHITAGTLPKGDVLATARVAGILATKRTPELLPLCHPIAIGGVVIELHTTGATVEIRATVRTADRTGVEMEALTAVAVTGLTVIDMIKGLDPAASIERVQVERKSGGKTGTWERTPEEAA